MLVWFSSKVLYYCKSFVNIFVFALSYISGILKRTHILENILATAEAIHYYYIHLKDVYCICYWNKAKDESWGIWEKIHARYFNFCTSFMNTNERIIECVFDGNNGFGNLFKNDVKANADFPEWTIPSCIDTFENNSDTLNRYFVVSDFDWVHVGYRIQFSSYH